MQKDTGISKMKRLRQLRCVLTILIDNMKRDCADSSFRSENAEMCLCEV